MRQSETFSRSKLSDYLACQRRYQLRYRLNQAWPTSPIGPELEQSSDLGRKFHLILQRHFLGLQISVSKITDPQLRRWWRVFLKHGPRVPSEGSYPEFNVTVPIGRYYLAGRLDLLAYEGGRAQIFDWKTSNKPQTPAKLIRDLQTQVYFALAVEGKLALPQPVDPDKLTLTYWFVNDPERTVTFSHSRDEHESNWRYLNELVLEIDEMFSVDGKWPLTDNLRNCERCAYQALCDRRVGKQELSDWAVGDSEVTLEPELP